MDYSRPLLIDALASSYVQGTLHGGAKRRFETLLLAHPALRNAVHDWQARLAPLSQSIPPRTPPKHVWQSIEQRLFSARTAPAPAQIQSQAWWQALWMSMGLWRSAAAFSVCVAIVAVGLFNTASQAPVVVVLNASNGAQQFVASVNSDGHSLTLTPVSTLATAPVGKSLQLWALPAKGQPQSLGVLTSGAPYRLNTPRLQAGLLSSQAFAISVEPIGGSPTGLPTGDVIASGKLY